MKLGSLFDGSGGFPLAAALCGIEPVWASEIEPYPIKVTTARFPNMKHLGDIRQINGAGIEPVDIITFGSPCQDLSIANGKRKGIKGERSGLFMDAIRIIKEMRDATNGKYPTFGIWENVFGAYSSNQGNDFRIVLESFAQIADPKVSIPGLTQRGGAGEIVADNYSIAYRTMSAQFWGVPQRRRRIYLVADFRGQRAGKILFEREGLRRDFTQGKGSWEAIAAHTGNDAFAPITFKERAGCPGGGKGILIQNNLSATLSCNNDQAVLAAGFSGKQGAKAGSIAYQAECAPTLRAGMESHVLCLNDQGGKSIGVTDNVSGTLRAQEHGHQPCVCVHPEISGTLCASGAGASRPAGQCNELDYCLCIAGNTIDRQIQNGGNGLGVKENISYTLNTIDRHAVCFEQQGYNKYRESNISAPIKASGGNCSGGSECMVMGLASGKDVVGTLMANCATKQWLGNQEAFSGDYFICDRFAIRRLMPIECCRLQGFPSWWCDGVEGSDAAQYKMWGNGLALPCALYVLEGIAECGKEGF